MNSVHSAMGGRRRGAPPAGQRLNREAVIDEAGELIARDGLAAFSLRGLAQALGVAPNAVYNHVANREDLLDAIVERFLTQIRLPEEVQPWPAWMRAVATGLRSQLLEYPGLTDLILSRAGSTTAGGRVLTQFIDHLESAGLDRALAHVAWHAVLTTVVGSLWQEQARQPGPEPTFDAVLEVTMTGLTAAAERPTTPQALALLDAHTPAH